MSAFIMLIIMGFLMVIGGISLLATPLSTFWSTGYYIIVLFFISGIIGIIRCIVEKRFGKDLFFAILSLILGIAGFVVPGAAAMNNFVLLYMAATWFVIHGILTILSTLGIHSKDTGFGLVFIGILLGILEIVLGCYSAAHPALLALSLGMLIAFYFIESGIHMIFIGFAFSRAEAIHEAELLEEAGEEEQQ